MSVSRENQHCFGGVQKVQWGTLLLLLLLLLIFSVTSVSGDEKIILVDRLQEGSFKNGTTFAANGWTVVNDLEVNQWQVAHFPGEYPKAIISPDGGQTWAFDVNSSSIVHFYRDIQIPQDAKEVYLSFGNFGFVTPLFDDLNVYVVPTSTPAVAGQLIPFEPLRLLQKTRRYLWVTMDFQETILQVTPGSEIRLVFTWRNSGNGLGVQPPVGVSAIEVSYTPQNPLKEEISWQNPLPQGNDHNSIIAVDSLTGVSAGSGGTIGRTVDGGLTWSYQFTVNGYRSQFTGLWKSPNNLFVIAQPNRLLASADLGQNWQDRAEINTDSTMINGLAGSGPVLMAAGVSGSLYRSGDDGNSWSAISSGVANDLNSVAFGTGSDVLAGGNAGALVKSTDGGLTFIPIASGLQDIYDIESFGQDEYAAATLLGLYTTNNGGNTWTVVPGTDFFTINDIAMRDSSEGAATSAAGILFHTLDAWNSVGTKFTGDDDDFLTAVCLYPGASDATIAGTAGTLLYSDDFAVFDRLSSSSTVNDLHNAAFAPRDTIIDDPVNRVGWAVGDGGSVLQTFDGGLNWMPRSTGFFGTLNAIDGFKDGVVLAVGSPNQHIRSTDGGANWQMMNIPLTLGMNDVHLANSRYAVTVGVFGSVLTTSDGGQTWTQQSSGINNRLNSVDVLTTSFPDSVPHDSFTAIAVGNGGAIIQSIDGGNTWVSQSAGTSDNLRSVQLIDDFRGYIVGENGTFLRTENGGANWSLIPVILAETVNADLNALSFSGIELGVICTEDGQALRTLDGGDTWEELSSPVGHALNSITLFDAYSLTAVGESGTVIHTRPDSVIVTGISVHSPDAGMISHFSLGQNYPNPFNPSTTIEFGLPATSVVTLEIYDVLGRQVVEAFRETPLNPGVHKWIWNATDSTGDPVASGIYFYRLHAENGFSQSKKMLLIR